jgi:two-component system chemotaxis sensor kinase CheA
MDKTVLIVDDSNTNTFLLQSILETEGIQSSIAVNGQEAFNYLENQKPSLILLDIMMPDKDGFMVLEELKSKPNMKNIPVVFITAKNDTNIRKIAIEAGATELIQKPIDVENILKLVRSILFN